MRAMTVICRPIPPNDAFRLTVAKGSTERLRRYMKVYNPANPRYREQIISIKYDAAESSYCKVATMAAHLAFCELAWSRDSLCTV